MKRMVYVNEVDVTSTAIASGILIGDAYRVSPTANVLAVQVEDPEVLFERYDFSDFSVFSMHPSPELPPIGIHSFSYHERPIYVDSLNVIGASTSGVIQVGGIDHVDSISRTKHIRRVEEEQ